MTERRFQVHLARALLELQGLSRALARVRRMVAWIPADAPSRRHWTKAEIAEVRRRYRDEGPSAIARNLGRAVSSVYQQANRLGLKADPELNRARAREGLAIAGRRFRFQKGIVPWNKGKKIGPARGRASLTTFKKGNRPHTWKPIGTVTVRKDGYQWVKVRDGHGYNPHNFREAHVLLWEKHRGPVPKGKVLRFKDGNPRNLKLGNLHLISRRRNMQLNTIHRYPAPLKRLIYAQISLKRSITMRRKRERKN